MRIGLGAAYFGAAKYPQAISVFADLLQSEPDNAMVADLLGISCNAVTPEPRPRCAVLVHYAESHPADPRASAYAAAYLLSESDSESRRPLIRKLIEAALAADPPLPEAQFQMGTFLEDDGQWNDSIPYLERAIQLKPDYSQAHYHLALAYWRTGRKQEGQAQMALQRKYSRQQQQDLDRRLNQITTFLLKAPN
jgi:tetratricopeptide (TPR) repeat protein